MNTLINKTKAALSNIVLIASACVMAGLGFAVVATLAISGLIAVGVALAVAPFMTTADAQDEQAVAATA